MFETGCMWLGTVLCKQSGAHFPVAVIECICILLALVREATVEVDSHFTHVSLCDGSIQSHHSVKY